MNASQHPINRDDVIAELNAQIQHATGALKGRLGRVRRSLMEWISSLEDARKAVAEGMTTETQVRALVDRGCRLAGAFPAEQIGNRGRHTVWMTTSEDMSNNAAIVQHLGRLLRTQVNGPDMSPWGRINRRSVGRRN